MIVDVEKLCIQMKHSGIPITIQTQKPLETSRHFLFPSDIESITHRCYPSYSISFSLFQRVEDSLQKAGYPLLRGTMSTDEMEKYLRQVPIESDSDFVHHLEFVNTKSPLFRQEFSSSIQYWILEYVRQKVKYYNFEPEGECDTQASLLWNQFIQKATSGPCRGQLDTKIYDNISHIVYPKFFLFHDFWEAYFLCVTMNHIIQNIQEEVWSSDVMTIGDAMKENKKYEQEMEEALDYFGIESQNRFTDFKKCIPECLSCRKI